MAQVPFVHLHVHSEYSFLRSTLRAREIPRLAAELQMPAVALTDRNNLHGVISFYDACYHNGIKPIIGADITIEPLASGHAADPARPPMFNFVILAEDLSGYVNLCELLTRMHQQPVGPHLCARRAWLEELAGRWIILSGGLDGEIAHALQTGNTAAARAAAEILAHHAGPGRFYIELQWHQLPEERALLPQLMELARALNIPVVAANQCAYRQPDEARAVALLRRIEENAPVNAPEELEPVSNQFTFRKQDEMAAIFRNAPEALANSVAIADRCAVILPLGTGYLLPRFEPPDGSQPRDFIQRLCQQGLRARYPDYDEPAAAPRPLTKKKRRELEARLAFELETITQMGFISYFLIVADFVGYARRQGIPVGPGRGSAAGSLVSYLLGITDLDPLDHGLLFERFLNPARKKLPDIDIDFCERRRAEVIAYVRERYGADNVAQIATFSTLRYKAALRDIGKVLSLPDTLSDRFAAMIAEHERMRGMGRSGAVRAALDRHEPLRELYLRDPQAKLVLDLACMIEDLPRTASTHAAGVVIAPRPLRTLVPLMPGAGGEIVTQTDMYAIERLGLLKMDFLGLTTLTILDDAQRFIAQLHQTPCNLESLPLNDRPTFELLQRGDVFGLFQLETSAGMRRLVQRMQIANFDDLVAVIALYRPGALHAADDYIARRHGREPISYPHPALERVLKDTYGVMIYQEQVMQALRVLAGYSLAEADTFRQIMSKKLVEQINNERDRFLRRAAEKGLPPDQTDNLFDLISKFANYGFNKSHAAAYAVVTYRTAYVKANYPAEFFAALLNSRADAATHVQECRLNCQALGVRLLGPDVNQSAAGFSVEREPDGGRPAIRYGLEAIRNVGPSAAKALLDERTANGPFRSIDEFCRRVRTRAVTRRTLESLVKAGACDCFGLPRQRLCLVVDDICARWERSGESALQRSFFDDFNDAAAPRDTVRIELDAVAEWEPLTRLLFEKEALGIYLSGHPLETYRAFWRAATTADARNTGFIREPDGGEGELLESPPAAVLMGGLVLSADWRMSRRGKSYGILTIEDFYGAFEALVWSDLVEQWRGRITPNQILFVRGTLRESFGRTALSVSALAEAPDAMAGWVDVLQLNIPRAHASAAALARVADVVKAHPGDTPVELCLPGTDPATPVRRIEARTRVTVTEALLAGLMELLGDDAVRCLVRI